MYAKLLEAVLRIREKAFIVDGFGGAPSVPDDVVNVGNSGTTLRFALMTAGLAEGYTVFTGDRQIRRRPVGPLIRSMKQLGGEVFSTRGNDMAPVVVKGKLKGGTTRFGFLHIPVPFITADPCTASGTGHRNHRHKAQ